MVNQLLAAYGMLLNKKLKVSLMPSDHGVFDVVLDGKLVFSRHKAGRFPTVDELRKEIEPKLTVPPQV